VVQEALTNAVRHGRPRAVAVRVHRSGGVVELDVTDDGCGGSAGAGGGHGLVGMRERLRAYGGTLDAGPRPEGGWRVQARVPVPTA
jgi:signal transduction histidine kinase